MACLVIRILVLVAPFAIHLGTRGVAYVLGSSSFPTWTVAAASLEALAALAVAIHDVRAVSGKVTGFAWGLATVGTLLSVPLVAWLLYLLIDLLAGIVALPYTMMLAALILRAARRWSEGPDLDA